MSIEKLYHCKVFIVGSGPSGMVLAHQLQEHKIDYLMSDKRKLISNMTRAVNLTPAALGALEFSLGLNLGEKSTQTDIIKSYWKGKLINRVSYKYKKYAYKKFNYLPQPILENILYEKLNKTKSNILEESEVIDIKKEIDGFLIKINSKKQGEIMIKAEYLIGCDGNGSFVRQWANIKNNEEDYQSDFILYDVETRKNSVKDSCYFLLEDGYIIIVPISESCYRIIVSSKSLNNKDKSTYNNIEFINYFLKNHCPLELNIKHIRWFTFSSFKHRIANSCQKDNCFLVGDAFHVFSPVGGLNLNTGLQDALNLGWKLAYVIKGYADKKLLKSYSLERKRAVNSVKKKTKHLTKVMTLSKKYKPSKKYIEKLSNKYYIKDKLPELLAGYESYSLKESDQNIKKFKAGDHISKFINNSEIYSNICLKLNKREFNLITSKSMNLNFLPTSYHCLEHLIIPELLLNDYYILIRPDGYIHKISHISAMPSLDDYHIV